MSTAVELEERIGKAFVILQRGLDRHRDERTREMCGCGSCLAMLAAIRALKGKYEAAQPTKKGE